MATCPICYTESTNKVTTTPYWDCGYCGCWWQQPLPPKVYEADHEKDAEGGFTGHLMSDQEKDINNNLAISIFTNWMGGKPGKTLDIGAKYPYLAHCFKKQGCDSYAMDNIEIVPEYSKALDVPMLMADFEELSKEQIQEWTHTEKFQLITMIHMFEHLYDPLAALKKMKKLLADDGVLFLRLPQHDVSGFERDLTPGHYTIHPFFHSLSSLLELLVRAEDLFSIEWHSPMDGAGQRDLVLRPLKKKPVLYAGMIVKNEERDLPKCLESIKSVIDGLVIIDTGSTDSTRDTAITTWPLSKPLIYETYTEASEKDETGDWKLWDFAKARNQFLNIIETYPEVDYVIWMDADDILVSPPQNLRRAIYLSGITVFGVMIESGDKWVHHRMWKTGKGIHFEGAIHEYPTIGGHPEFTLTDTVIHHDPTPCIGENSNARNLRILLKEHETNPSSRNLFYLANTYKDSQTWEPAIKYYADRIALGEFYRDEWLFSYLYKARCERANGDIVAAEKTLLEALSKATDWSEFWMELSYIFLYQGKNSEAMSMALMASTKTPPPTALWRETNKYTDQPLRVLSFCTEYMGDAVNSLAWAQKAKAAIGVPDKEWDERITRLESQLGAKRQIVLVRPGAIGDIIMTLNCIPQLKKLYPEHDILYYCNKFIGDSLRPLMHLAGVDKVCDYNKDVIEYAKADKVVNLVGYPLAEGYPNVPMKKHLVDYFAAEMGCLDTIYPLSLKLPRVEGLPTHYVTIHAKAGWSNYKNWSPDRWAQVISLNKDIPFYQIGAEGDPLIEGADHRFVGTPIMTGLALISNATMHVGVDSFSNHATYVFNTPAVILWGSTQWSAAGYPNNTNISLGLECQPCFREDPAMSLHPKGPCINPPGQVYEEPRHACMSGISVHQVNEAVKTLWDKSIRSKR